MSSTTRRWLVLVGIVALAFNLRPAAVSVGPVLAELRTGLDMTATEAGLLTSLPVLAFAVFGGLAARLARAVGPHRLTLLALLAVVVGLLGRTRVDHVGSFLLLSLVALAGMATANVLLPSLVRRHFPTQVGRVTAAYTTALSMGLTGASVLTVPLAAALGDWRDGLVVWALTAAVAVIPWIGLVGRDAGHATAAVEGETVSLGAVARTRLGWAMAVLFASQSVMAYAVFGWFAAVYREAGFSAAQAGVLLGVITAISIPASLVVPGLAARRGDVRPLVWLFFACYVVGYAGLAVAPASGAWVWAVIVGVALATFPLTLALIGLRARTSAGTAALSGFTQSAGYLMAAPGPLLVGVLHDVTGGWAVPLGVLALLALPLLVSGLAVGRPAYVEDQLR